MKVGMYGEMPVIKVGRFKICQMTDKENEKNLWIENEEGEGGEFHGDEFEKTVSKFFDDTI